jgi:hypothetical protein
MQLFETHDHIDFFDCLSVWNYNPKFGRTFLVHPVYLLTIIKFSIVDERGTPSSVHILICAVTKNIEVLHMF